MTAIKLPDALVEALKGHDVQDIESIEAFAARAMWEKLEEEEAEIEATVAMCKQSMVDFEKGNFMPLEEFIAKRIELREAERAARIAAETKAA
jgi:hypothetical protein